MKNVNELIQTKEEFILFQDDWVVVLFNEDAMTLGHIRIFPKEPIDSLDKLSGEQSNYLFSVASKCATLLFDGMKCHGTNIIVKDGVNAQNEYDRLCIEAIARFQDDGLDMYWEPKQGNQAEIKQIGDQIKDAIIIGGEQPTTGTAQVETVAVKSEEKEFWETQFRRIP